MRLAMVHLDLEVGNASALPKAIIGSPHQVASTVHDHRSGRVDNAPPGGHEVIAIVALLVPLEEVEARCSELVGLERGLWVQAVEAPVVEVW